MAANSSVARPCTEKSCVEAGGRTTCPSGPQSTLFGWTHGMRARQSNRHTGGMETIGASGFETSHAKQREIEPTPGGRRLCTVAGDVGHAPSSVSAAGMSGAGTPVPRSTGSGFVTASRSCFTMIGLLSNLVIPGEVGGDLVKAYYITRQTDRQSASAFTAM